VTQTLPESIAVTASGATRPGRTSLAVPFDQVERIAVLRGGGLGDLLAAEPALRALAARYPGAELTLLGKAAHAQLLIAPRSAVSGVEDLPAAPGIRDDGVPDPTVTGDFIERMRDVRFDLAVQLHGGGRFSNPFLLRLGARHTVGMATPDAVPLERTLPYQYYQHEVLRALEVVGLAGAAPVSLEPVIDVRPEEHARSRMFAPQGRGPLLAIHPGATDPRRRWPYEKFAAVAREAATSGARVVVVGDDSDREVAAAIVESAVAGDDSAVAARITSCAGRLSLPALAGLLAHADVLLANDSGPRHLAQALGIPTVSVYWIGNLVNAGPLSRALHRVHVAWTTACPVCQRDVTQEALPRCEHDVSFVADVPVRGVADDVAGFLARM
jgi:ADP-heptose:LPS heptosyltransferase